MKIFLTILIIIYATMLYGQNPSTAGNVLMKSNGSVSIGTEANTSPLTIANFTTPFITPQSGTLLHIVSDAVTNGRFSFDTYNDVSANGSIFQGRRARGSAGSPTAAIADDILVAVGGDGYGDNAFHNISLGGFTLRSLGTMTNSSSPTYITFSTVPNASTTQAERVRIQSDGTFRVLGLNSVGVLQTDADGDFVTKSYADTKTDLSLNNVTNESKATMFTSPTFTGNPVLATPASGNFTSGSFNWPTFNQNTTGSAAALTTTRTIWGQNFNGTANVTGDLALGVSSITMSGSIGVTGTRVTKIWATDGEFTNMLTVGGTSLSSTFQPLDADLTTIAGLTATTDNFLVSVSSAWASRTPTQVKTTLALNNVTNESKATMFTSPTFTGTPVVPGYQPLATNLTSIGALANASGFLKNDGAGTFTYETPAGGGTVTNTGNLTSNSVVLGNGTTDTKVVAGITTNGTAQLVLGVNTTTLGSVKMFGNTSGDATIQPAAVAGTATVITLPNVTSTLLPNTTTSGVAATATASGTQTVTHNLGRIPTTIRIYSISSFTSNAAATPVPFSMGVFNSSGNRCVYMVINGTTTQVSQTSTTFSIIMVTSAGNQITGVIQNLTSTGFDIVWTETGTHTAGNFVWEAQ